MTRRVPTGGSLLAPLGVPISAPVRGSGRAGGFTLLELLVVLVIMAFAAALVPPLLTRSAERASIRGAALSLSSELRLARSRAVTDRSVRAVVIDAAARQFGTDAEPARHRVAGSVTLLVRTAALADLDGRAAIRFFPNGGSTGGEVLLENERTSYRVAVNWLTGRVSVEEPGR